METQLKLTNEQRKVVEENYHLISEFLEMDGLDPGEDEQFYTMDFHGAAATGLCKAAIMLGDTAATVDPETFRSFAYSCISNEVYGDMAGEFHDMAYTESYEDILDEFEYANSTYSTERLEDVIERTAAADAMNAVLSPMLPADRDMIESLIMGWMSVTEVSKKYKAHVSYVRKLYNGFLQDVKQILLS